jgi:hypothetical protein
MMTVRDRMRALEAEGHFPQREEGALGQDHDHQTLRFERFCRFCGDPIEWVETTIRGEHREYPVTPGSFEYHFLVCRNQSNHHPHLIFKNEEGRRIIEQRDTRLRDMAERLAFYEARWAAVKKHMSVVAQGVAAAAQEMAKG